ncbi:MAG: hypothetical protein C0592_09730 [Marinilabiliales bacterium]|nr:MAG: hypothetical protein C0592_09730 [Marinilabiliales bacterium]
MKTLTSTILMFLIGIVVFAQPSQGTMIAKIKANHPSATSVELTGNGYTEQSYDNGAYRDFYLHSYRIKAPTEYSDITYCYSGQIQYVKSGGAWVFDNFNIGDKWYEGVPDPDWNEILALLMSDIEGYVKNNHYVDIVGNISPIELTDDPDFHWHDLNSVSFNTKVTYSEKQGYTKLAKGERYYRVRLYSDGYQEPWKSFNSTYEKDKIDKNSFEITEYTSEELDAMKTLYEIDMENAAAKELENLPKIEVKKFESGKQLYYYTHDIILTKEKDVILAYFYKVIDKETCFVKGSSSLMSNDTREWVDKVLDNLEAYRACYCLYPTVKEEKETRIRFYDRENRRMLDMAGVQRNDTWMLTEVDFYAANEDEQARLKSNSSNCQDAPDLTYVPPREVVSYKVGDAVTGVFSNGEYNATIDKTDPYNSQRYFIKLIGDNSGKGYWMEEKNLKQGHVGTNINGGGSSSSSSSQSFKVDDVVYVNTTKGKMKATIKEISGEKALVDFKNPMYDDTWVSLSNCSYDK